MQEPLQVFERRVVPPAYRPLVRIKGKNRVAIVPVGQVHTWMMHWCGEDRRTMPCVMGRCNECLRYVSKRPLSYCAIAHQIGTGKEERWSPGILEIPLQAGLMLQELIGRPLYLFRDRPRGPVEVIVHEGPFNSPNVADFPIVPTLLMLWRLPPDTKLRLLSQSEVPMWNVAHD